MNREDHPALQPLSILSFIEEQSDGSHKLRTEPCLPPPMNPNQTGRLCALCAQPELHHEVGHEGMQRCDTPGCPLWGHYPESIHTSIATACADAATKAYQNAIYSIKGLLREREGALKTIERLQNP